MAQPYQIEQLYTKIIADNVRTIRRARNESQTRLAAVLGVTFQQLQKYEGGDNRISPAKLVMIAQHYRIDIADLYAGIPHGPAAQAVA